VPSNDDMSVLYLSVGRAIANWARLEETLAFAFSSIAGTDPLIGTRVFFSARAFAGKHDMLDAAIRAALLIRPIETHSYLRLHLASLNKANR